MQEFDPELLKQLYTPHPSSHKGQNGKLLLIGGSHLFHAASLWSLEIASKLVDMVFYASVPENSEIVKEAKSEFRNGIVIPRSEIESYVQEADAILIGPGMVRAEHGVESIKNKVLSIKGINEIEDEGEHTYALTKYLLYKYPEKKWVVDGGALQMTDPEWLRSLTDVIITPHQKEFDGLELRIKDDELRTKIKNRKRDEQVQAFAEEFDTTVLLKGEKDIVCSPSDCVVVSGGNAGMTKGGTGDVLAGLVVALFTKNDAFLSAAAGSYINKKAGEYLYGKQGYAFNSSDLVNAIPVVMKELVRKQ